MFRFDNFRQWVTENPLIIQKPNQTQTNWWYPLIFVILVIVVGSVQSNVGSFADSIPRLGTLFHYSCQLLVKDEHWVYVLVKGFGFRLA